MKKTLALSLIVGGGLVLSGCQFVSFNQDDIQPVVETKTMAFQATTALTMVDGFDSPTLSKTMSRLMNQDEAPIEEVDVPIATLDMLFNNGSSFTIEQKASDREGYTNLDVISFKILEEETITYSLYYNVEAFETPEEESSEEVSEEISEIIESEEVIDSTEAPSEEISEPLLTRHGENGGRHGDQDGDGHHGDYDDDDADYDREGDNGHHGFENGEHEGRGHAYGKDHYRVTGLAVVGEEEYRFMSKTETDTDGDEQEVELKFMMFKDEGNFISIKQEIETEGVEGEAGYEYEEEFKYMVVKDNELVKSFKLELENEDDAQELEVKIDGVKYEVTYETIEDRTYIHVSVSGQGEYTYEKVVTTNEETNEVSVAYILQTLS